MKNMILTVLIAVSTLIGLISCGHSVTNQNASAMGSGVAGSEGSEIRYSSNA